MEAAKEAGRLIGVDALIFGKITATFEPGLKGTEKTENRVWTGDYKRDSDGDILEENILGIWIKKKKYLPVALAAKVVFPIISCNPISATNDVSFSSISQRLFKTGAISFNI